MPTRPLPYCTTPGCGERTGAGRCPTCRARADRFRGSPAERGYDARWLRTRNAYLLRHPMCEAPVCFELAAEVDHIDGLGPLGPRGHDPENLRALCKSHHSKRTAADQPGGWWAEARHSGR